MSAYQHIAQRAVQGPVRRLCQVLRVAPAAYHAWPRRRQRPPVELAGQVTVREAFAYHRPRHGTRRLRAEVQAAGHRVGRGRIRRVLQAHGLRAPQPRALVPRTTDSDPAVRAAPNRLLDQPVPTAPNRVRVGDITYLPTGYNPVKAAAGSTWPAGWTVARAKSWAGTCVRPCPKTWSAKRCAGPWSCAARQPGSSCTPTRAVSTRPPDSRTYSLAMAQCRA